jgi:hypothetical protein
MVRKAALRALIALIGTIVTSVSRLPAQPVMIAGTGDPNRDISAIQAAVDQGGHIILTGHFSFDQPPTKPDGAIYSRMVTVSNEVVISGGLDANGSMPTIEAGNWPFFIDAAGARVSITGVHFVRPTAGAIWVYAVSGLTIANCRIENVEPTLEFGTQAGVAGALSGGIGVYADPHPPSKANPGTPQNFSGTLSIVGNDIDMGATNGALSLGIVIFSVGVSPDREVDIYVSGNNVRNVTEPAINLRVVGGRAHVERNTIVTGAVMGGAANPDAIRVVGSGSYLVAHNSIDCGWTDGAATAINVIGQQPPMTISNAVIIDNDVTMSAPDGTVFGPNSAAIELRGYAQGNSVLNNRMKGRARTALSVADQGTGIPAGNTLTSNDVSGFHSLLADVFIDAGATNTVVVGSQAGVEDHGIGSAVIPMR